MRWIFVTSFVGDGVFVAVGVGDASLVAVGVTAVGEDVGIGESLSKRKKIS